MVRSMEAGMNGARTVDENLLHLDTKLKEILGMVWALKLQNLPPVTHLLLQGAHKKRRKKKLNKG